VRLTVLLIGLLGSLLYQGCWREPTLLLAHAVPPKPKQVSSDSVQLLYREVNGIPVRYVVADLNSPYVRVGVVTARRLGTAESVWDLLGRSKPTAAVTGTYFSSTSKLPVGDIAMEGERVHFGGVGTALCITYDNQVRFIRQRLHRQHDWRDYRLVLGAGPRLLQGGKVARSIRQARASAISVSTRGGKRVAVGVTKHNKLLLVVVERPLTLRQLAWVMHALGATDAIALDGGGSTCLYYRGALKVPPKRKLTNLLVVYEDYTVYDGRLAQLKPLNRLASR
jgi:hypothetical protein